MKMWIRRAVYLSPVNNKAVADWYAGRPIGEAVGRSAVFLCDL